MNKIKSLADLRQIKDSLVSGIDLREKSENAENLVQIKVAMATCGIASGAKEVMDFLISALDKRGIEAVITQTGCMGYCFAEPTIEVKKPNAEPLVFGHVTLEKADE
ncbi:MAG: (2Fe-2S) ferredoxin domain-containing protein, partial [Bacteroidales bacterium]